MENKTFYNEILTEHNLHPYHKHKLEDANLVLEGVNPSCGDDIFLELKVEDGVVVDGAFEGDGCAEVCYEIGCYYLSVSDPQEASIWLSAALSAPCILQLEVHKRAESALQKCQGKLSE